MLKKHFLTALTASADRPVVRYSNPEGQGVMWWTKSAPLIGIGITDLPNSGRVGGPR